ncbi:MAG: DUF4402 domain-containing protein [Erythrobacter sp.]|jgi:hypothetical protein
MTFSKTLLALIAAAMPTAAFAAPGDSATTAGASDARIVEPLALQSLEDLRFGTFVRPTAAGTVTIAADSTVTSALDLAAFPNGRGAASFLVRGTANRLFITFLPTTVTITNGTATMRVDTFRKNGGAGLNRLDANGYHVLTIGARLRVNANQQAGNYSGNFAVRVLYL